MARQSRAQRRARRAQMTPAGEAALPGGPPAPPRRPTARAAVRPEPSREPRAVPGRGLRGFVGESIAELKKVEWPDQKAVISGTVVVIVACVIVGTWLWAADKVWQYVVQHVLLR